MSGQPLAFLTERQWGNEGLVEALCIQLPERVHKELPELVPTITDYGSVRKGFIESIIWRDPQAITESTRLFLNKYASQSQHTSDQVLNALLTVAVNPDHPYNADFLHVHLMNFEMAARDAWWSIFLHEQYGTHDSVDRLIDWAWSPEKKEHIADEAVRLAGTILGWFLTTSNRFLRDRATKALVNLLTSRVPVLHTLVQQFIQVNDPYILERLFAAAYGCVLRSIDDKAIGTFAQAVYNWIFREGTSPVHILLRDYARGIIEYALSKDIVLDVEVDKIRPPYRSEWPTIPTEDEIKQYDLPLGSYGSGDTAWSQNRIYHSIMADDFAWYVIGTNSGWSRWLSLPLNEPRWRSSKETCEEFAASLTGEKKIRWEQLQTLFEEYDRERDNWPIRSILEKLTDEQLQALIESSEEESEILLSTPQDIRLHFIDLEQEQKHQKLAKKIEKSTEQLRAILGDDEKHLFTTEILPYLSGSPQLRDAPRFDLALAQRWILKRVFELGWTMDRFGQFDRFHIGYEGRSGHKAERIGKKYQWIAYHEFLAMVADNFQFRRGHFDSDTEDKYVGAWQIGIRDIDPSCILKATGRGNSWQVHSPVWWFPHKYDSWENPTDEIEWMKRLDDLPNIESLIEVINPMDGSQWLTLDGYYTWEQPTPPEEEKFKISRREIWYILQSYLVHQPDVDDLFAWAKEQDFMGRWMPETHALGEVFLGEFFWSSTYKYFNDPHARVVSWQGDSPDSRIPKPIMPLADGYMQEDSGFDCSVDETINIKLPNQHLAEKMGLSWNGVEGSYFDKEGKLTVFDPSVRGNGPSVLLIERDAFLSFLAQNNYAVVWTILGEKQLIGGGFDHKNWKGRMKLSGAYRFLKDQLEGKITPTFQAPANASRT